MGFHNYHLFWFIVAEILAKLTPKNKFQTKNIRIYLFFNL